MKSAEILEKVRYYVWVDEMGEVCSSPKIYKDYQQIEDAFRIERLARGWGHRLKLAIEIGTEEQLRSRHTDKFRHNGQFKGEIDVEQI